MRIPNLLGVLLLPACVSTYQEAKKPLPDPDLENSAIARAQFEDIPAPEGFRLRTETMQSYSYQCGSFRQGRLLYSGRDTAARAASYLRERLPQHGWEPAGETIESARRQLQFKKGKTLLLCDLASRSRRLEEPTSILMVIQPADATRPPTAVE